MSFIHLWVRGLRGPAGRQWAGLSLAFLFLIIVFYDELSYAVGRAALPSLRAGLGLSYAQVGLLLGLPQAINAFIEPGLMLLGDTRLRKNLMIAGGIAIALASVLIAWAGSFTTIMLAFILVLPASGAFVSLSEATLMDMNPGREAQMMARWSVAGTLGNLVGPLLLAGGFALALGWRWAYVVLGLAGFGLAVLLLPRGLPTPPGERASGLLELLRGLWKSGHDPNLLR
jgi:FSR family fosmidomycin resistance protein-like MFS transporter